eukprot:TRINITY_DN631_c0_g1_i1.p1 TRINITY_DN631_c0_g1~~TRINITY_DN631_c0_g1_i1.p1  ORF type:complete len:221 (+),score=44.92 TRINITY_DN631_c0_g1_i1:77-739(+)
MKALLLVCLLSFVIAAYSQAPCCTPNQWQDYNFNWEPYRGFAAGINITYDAVNTRTVAQIFENVGPERTRSLDIIALYASKQIFMIDWKRNRCVLADLTEPFEKACIPQQANFLTSITLGGSLNAYVFGWESFNGTYDISIVSADGNCWPISNKILTGQSQIVDGDDSWNVTPGVANTNIFTPPSFCPTLATTSFENFKQEVRALPVKISEAKLRLLFGF